MYLSMHVMCVWGGGWERKVLYASGCYCVICICPPVFSLLIFISRHFLIRSISSYDTYFAIDEVESMVNDPNRKENIYTFVHTAGIP